MLAQWVTLPIETIQRMQASSNLSVGQLARQVYAEKGLLGFWANAGLLTVQIVLEKAVFFFAFVVLRWLAERLAARPARSHEEVLVGYAAELARLPANYPFEVVTMTR